jgi:hypothetical protein
LKQFAVAPEQVDEIVLAAINVSLNLDDVSLVTDIPQLRIDNPSIKPDKAA